MTDPEGIASRALKKSAEESERESREMATDVNEMQRPADVNVKKLFRDSFEKESSSTFDFPTINIPTIDKNNFNLNQLTDVLEGLIKSVKSLHTVSENL